METQFQRNRTGQAYDRTLGRLISSERLLAVLFCLLLNSIVYWGAQILTAGWPMLDMTTALDRKIPVQPMWTLVYVGAYLFWAVNYVLMARGRDWYRIMAAEATAKLICGLFFVLLPTTNIRPMVQGSDVGAWLLRLIYQIDAASNLFPSIHCLESWICFAGLRGRKNIPLWYRIFSGIFAAAVCISTLTTRQHVLADVIAGVLLAEAALFLSRRFGRGRYLERIFCNLDKRLFGV